MPIYLRLSWTIICLDAHAMHKPPHSLNELIFCHNLCTWITVITWMFKAQSTSEIFANALLHGLQFFLPWCWRGNRLELYRSQTLQKHHAWREPWPCFAHIVRISAQKFLWASAAFQIFCQPLQFHSRPWHQCLNVFCLYLGRFGSCGLQVQVFPALLSSYRKRGVFTG